MIPYLLVVRIHYYLFFVNDSLGGGENEEMRRWGDAVMGR
jgi:hypothetical protein